MNKRRFIVHVDMDAFFASIEERDNPAIRGKPIVVGADPKGGKGRGVVSTCSYAAREFGIHSAMPISIAYRKCPRAVFLPVNMDKYEAVSGDIYRILYDFTPDIEPVGIDEAFLDMTGSFHLFGAPLEACRLMKSRIRDRAGLTASVGLAPTKMAAKIASDLEKPDGLVEVTAEGLLDFLRPLEIRRIPGLGEKSEAALNAMGIKTIGDLASRDVNGLIAAFGKSGADFWRLANGIDERTVSPESEARSISNEATFDKDTLDSGRIASTLLALCEKVSHRLRERGLKGRTITLKIRLEPFRTYTRSVTRLEPTNFFDAIHKEITVIHKNFDAGGKKIRLVGVKVSGLSKSAWRDDLFADGRNDKIEKVHKALDGIREKFGAGSIYRAGGHKRQ